jgi:aromatic ring-cleaving dioxygenase
MHMNVTDPPRIESWHAHVYFDAATRDAAWSLREAIAAALADAVSLGRFHERPVGPHPMWSYQLTILPDAFNAVVAWLTLHHGALDVFIHPNTGDQLRDHRDRALWLGHSHTLDLAAVGG